MIYDAHKNFAFSTVATAPSPATSGLSLVVATGDGANFPAGTFNAVVCPVGQQPTNANAEIVRATRAGDTFAIVRAQEGTAARTIINGDQIFAAVTAKTLTDIEASTPVTLLSDTTLSADGTFDVSSIDQGYGDLILSLIGRGTAAGASDSIAIRFNNDSGANYDWQQTTYFGTSSGFSQGAADTRVHGGQMPAGAATANYFGMYEIYVPGYASTTWVKRTVQPLTMYETTAGTPAACANVGLWRNTAAVNRIQVLGNGTANLKAGSRLRIYGRV